MSNLLVSNQIINIVSIGGIAQPGLLGSQQIPRATEIRGLVKVYHFNFDQDTPNQMPGTSGGYLNTGTDIIIALLKPTDRLYAGFFQILTAWGGTNPVMSFGRIDPNDSTNTDNTFWMDAAVAMDSPILWFDTVVLSRVAAFNQNLCVQVGADPQGDQSVGNQLPEFGAADIQITATVASDDDFGSTSGTVEGYLLVVEEGN